MIEKVWWSMPVHGPQKTAFCLAHIKCQCQILASGGGKPLGGAHLVHPAPPSRPSSWCSYGHLALAANNDATVLQQLTAANLARTTSSMALTAANKNLAEALAKVKGGLTPAATLGPEQSTKKAFPGNNC